MIRLRILCSGRLTTPGLAETAEYFESRLRPWAKLETLELRSENDRTKDSARLCDKLSDFTRDRILVLAEQGAEWSTTDWAKTLEQSKDRGQTVTLVIGAANGLDLEMLRKRGIVFTPVAFGKATLAHELAQVVALEQLYRALSLLAGHPYHRA
jgi:23S rRNA (pseudouridine1915-N3)-methyltransferase